MTKLSKQTNSLKRENFKRKKKLPRKCEIIFHKQKEKQNQEKYSVNLVQLYVAEPYIKICARQKSILHLDNDADGGCGCSCLGGGSGCDIRGGVSTVAFW